MSEQDAGAGRRPYGRLRELFGGGRARPKAVLPLPIDPLITSRDLEEEGSRLRRRSKVPAVHLLRAAVVTGRTPGEVAARLAELGYELPTTRLPARAEPADLLLLSWSADAGPPWCREDHRIPEYRLRSVATAAGMTREQVIARLEELGHRTG